MTWLEPLVLHWARRIPAQELEQHVQNYRHWLSDPLADGKEADYGQ
jgi:glutathione-regulated potassium-efflux system ancillary protein KefG